MGVLSIAAMAGVSDAPEGGAVKWMTFEEAIQKSKTEKRPVFHRRLHRLVWWCKVMDKNTFNDPKVAQLLNEKFYAVKFNAEQREDVIFDGHIPSSLSPTEEVDTMNLLQHC
jgi:thioredoxin-related protein